MDYDSKLKEISEILLNLKYLPENVKREDKDALPIWLAELEVKMKKGYLTASQRKILSIALLCYEDVKERYVK